MRIPTKATFWNKRPDGTVYYVEVTIDPAPRKLAGENHYLVHFPNGTGQYMDQASIERFSGPVSEGKGCS